MPENLTLIIFIFGAVALIGAVRYAITGEISRELAALLGTIFGAIVAQLGVQKAKKELDNPKENEE